MRLWPKLIYNHSKIEVQFFLSFRNKKELELRNPLKKTRQLTKIEGKDNIEEKSYEPELCMFWLLDCIKALGMKKSQANILR